MKLKPAFSMAAGVRTDEMKKGERKERKGIKRAPKETGARPEEIERERNERDKTDSRREKGERKVKEKKTGKRKIKKRLRKDEKNIPTSSKWPAECKRAARRLLASFTSKST